MAFREQFERLISNLLALGPRRLALLAAIGVAVFGLVGAAGYFLSRPTNEILYAGLDKEDVSSIGAALREAGVNFDVSADGATVYVGYGDTAHARMLLAEKGLPRAPGTGYELFDKIGALGLTSFMQQITRVRALEGELARTIQTMNGVKAARVHLVMPDEGSFRRAKTPPSASVVLRTDGGADNERVARAVRHLVAAAMPGMKVDQVTVLNVDGQLLASGDDGGDSGPSKMLSLEKSVSEEIQANVRRTLAPYLSLRNFQISVAARLNTDKKQTTETTYDPDSKVERSVRTDKETQTSQNSTTQQPTSVGQNVPQPNASQGNGKQANEDSNKKEELTNYEISSKTMSTVSNGFAIEHLSVAVLINRAGIAATLGDKATPEQIDKQVGVIEQLVSSAAGLRKDRGDVIKVAAVDFIDSGKALEPVPPISLTEALMRQFGSIVSALAMLAVAILVVWLGLRPTTRALIDMREPLRAESALALAGAGAAPALDAPGAPAMIGEATREDQPLLEDWTPHRNRAPQKRLEQLIEFDEAQAAAVLKQWIRHGERV